MKKILVMLFMLLAICAPAFADDADDKVEIAPDYQAVLGGGKAVVELTDKEVMAAVANLKVYDKIGGVMLPYGLNNYRVIRAGKGQAFLIIPHYAKTRITVRNTATRKEIGSIKKDMEGDSLVLFCNKGDTTVEMMVRSSYGIQLVSFVPDAEGPKEDGKPGSVIIPERKERFLKDVTARIRHDGDIVKIE